MNGPFCNLYVLALGVDVTYLRYTVLTIPKKDETAVHCCDLALSVLVMLVSGNVSHVVSALQSIVFIHKWTAGKVNKLVNQENGTTAKIYL